MPRCGSRGSPTGRSFTATRIGSSSPTWLIPPIQTITTRAGQIEVPSILDDFKHVRPVVFTDAELPHVPEQDVSGITTYCKDFTEVLGERPGNVLPHEEIIDKLDQAAAVFEVLIHKTNLALPYTSVFPEPDCGYWNEDAERRLREALSTSTAG